MSFFAELIESFVPTLAFAEEPVEEVVETVVEETPAEETPVEEAPVEEAPVEEAPVEEAPVEEAPVEEAPVEEAPVEEAPVEEAPVEEAPVEETEAPAEEEEEEEEEEEDEEDEEEEGGDPLDKLRSECAETASIKPYVHHYTECVERVTKQQEDPEYEQLHYKEDCIEEFFHLQHHINDCVAPRLFAKLK